MPIAALPPHPNLLKSVLTIIYGSASRKSPPGTGNLPLSATIATTGSCSVITQLKNVYRIRDGRRTYPVQKPKG